MRRSFDATRTVVAFLTKWISTWLARSETFWLGVIAAIIMMIVVIYSEMTASALMEDLQSPVPAWQPAGIPLPGPHMPPVTKIDRSR